MLSVGVGDGTGRGAQVPEKRERQGSYQLSHLSAHAMSSAQKTPIPATHSFFPRDLSGYCLIHSISLDRASSRETCVVCASRGSVLTAWSLTRLWSGFSFHAYVHPHFKTHETAVLPTPVTPVPGPGLPGSEGMKEKATE